MVDLLQITRGLAAITVVFWHTIGHHGNLPPAINTAGRTAVWMFFGISGYVISHGFIHGRYNFRFSSLGHFYRNRLLRIYPLFLVLSCFAWVTALLTTGVSPLQLRDLPAQMFAIQFNHNYVLCGVFWTLGIELQLYVLAPLLIWPLLSRRYWVVAALALYAAVIFWYQYAVGHLGWSYDGRNLVSNLPHFLIGMIGCRLQFSGAVTVKKAPIALLAGGILVLAAIGVLGYTNWMYHRQPAQFWSVRGILWVDALILIVIFAHVNVAHGFPLKNWRLIYVVPALLGTLSYGIYAWHGYILQYAPWFTERPWETLGLTLLAAYGSYRLIEVPALKLKRYS